MFGYPEIVATQPPETKVEEPIRRKRIAKADRRIGEKASHINAAYAGLLAEIAEMDRLQGWGHHGAKTMEEWVTWRIGVTPAEARHHVRVARKLGELPLIFGAFRRGELSYWQVRAMAPVATPEVEEQLLQMARYSTAGQLQRMVRAFKSCLDRAELELTNARHAARSFSYHFDEDGFLQLHGRLDAAEGAVLVAALRAAEDAIYEDLSNDSAQTERPSPEQLRADALVDVARDSLDMQADETRRAGKAPARTAAVIHVDVPALIDGSGDRCEIADGPSIASETARRLTCDCDLQALYEVDGNVIDVGRKRRTVPPRMRKALEQRDRTCVYPGCDRARHLDAHHIVHWAHDGKTELVNLALLCRHHHRLVHEGGFSMRAEEDMTFTFFKPDGSVVPRSPGLGHGDLRLLIAEHHREQLAIDERTCTTLWDGSAPNYADCVDGLLQEGGMLARPHRGPPMTQVV
jgi:Domain of unknown function (DUF222)/HNH endonuclease